MSNKRIDLTQFEKLIEDANAYMGSWFKGTVTPMNGKEWRSINDLGLHVDWSHNEVFGPLVEEIPALVAELKRCYEKLDMAESALTEIWAHQIDNVGGYNVTEILLYYEKAYGLNIKPDASE